jgi:hypothetical protein
LSAPSGRANSAGEIRFEDLKLNVLLEVDPKSEYESFLRRQAERCTGEGKTVFVFTPEGSPLHRLFEGMEGVSLILLSLDTDSAQRGAPPSGRVSLLSLDSARFLTLLDSLIATTGRVYVFLDSISSLVMSLGFQESYRLLRQSIEIVGRAAGSRINAYAIMIRGTHPEAERNTFRSMFPVILGYDSRGLAVIKPTTLRVQGARPAAAEEAKERKPGGLRGFFGTSGAKEQKGPRP